jgi:DMSO reductase anchor subunit
MATRPEKCERVPLAQSARFLLEECRMVLPGIQALFGFQLIAVFNQAFDDKLGPAEQRLHLAAIALIAVAIALVMAPAAYHRQTGSEQVTETFIRISTRLVLWSMLPLAIGICLDFYLIARMILESNLAALLSTGLVCIFGLLWFVLPRVRALQYLVGGRE